MVGVTVSAEGVALCRLTPDSDQSWQLSHCVFEAMASSRDAPATLTRLIKQNGLQGLPCVFALCYTDYKIIRTDAPAVQPAELKDAVRWKIQEQIEWEPDDTVLDVFPLPESRQPGRPGTVCAVVANRALLQQRVEWLAQSGLILSAITIPELALTAYVPLMPENDTGVLLMHQAGDVGVLLAAKQDWMYLSRHVRLDQPASLSLDSDRSADRYDGLVLEIQRSLDYYESYFAEAPINDLVVTPSGQPEQDRPMLDGLHRQLNLQARTLDMTALFQTTQPLEDQLQSRCLIAAGAALSELAA